MKRTWMFALSALLLLGPVDAARADGWAWPLRGDVLTSYSNDNAKPYAGGMHRGIDIAADPGTRVVAARSGTVTYAGNLGSSGLTIAIKSSDDLHVASYLHLSKIKVEQGQSVAAGTPIGESGTSGTRSVQQPHLHFGVRVADRDNFYLDPLTLLPPLPDLQAGAATPVPATAPVRANEASSPTVARTRVPANAPARRRLAGTAPKALPAPGRAPVTRPRVANAPESAAAGGAKPAAAHDRDSERAPLAESPRVLQPQATGLQDLDAKPFPIQPGAAPGFGLGRLALAGGVLLLGTALLAGRPGSRRRSLRKRASAANPKAQPLPAR